MLDAVVAILVATWAKRAADGAADAAQGACSALVRLVRRKLGTEPGAAGVLAAAERDPDDPQRRAALAAALREAIAADTEFREQLRSLQPQAQAELRADRGGVASQLSGTAERLLQAGRDVTVNYLPAPDRGPAVPHQVPAASAGFVNRAPELSDLDRTLGRSGATGTPIGLLVGMPGVGKTALACQWAAAARGWFAGGELYVDYAGLRGRDGAGAAVPEAVASCLRGLGVDERFLPVGLSDLVNLFRTRTAERPVLVVLDGVTEPGQVRPLVPTAPGSAVVIATQYAMGELVREGAQVIPVNPLDSDAALSLLSSMCGESRIAAEPEAVRSVVRSCGGHPEALRAAGARLVLDPTLAVSVLADQLADEARRLAALSLPGWAATGVDRTVAAAFEVSYRALPAPAQQLYRDLGVLPVHEFGPDLLPAVPAGDPAGTGSALETLVAASLVHRVGPARYRMHPLVRLLAARQAGFPPGDRPARVIAAAVDYYVGRAGWADRAVMGADRLRVGGLDPARSVPIDPFTGPDHRVDRAAALAWLAAERAELLRVLRAAADAGRDESAWQLAEALTALYLNHRHHTDWIEATRIGVDAARRQGRDDVAARLRSLISRAFTDLGDLAQARTEVEAAGAAAAGTGNLVLQASVAEFRGRYLQQVDRSRAVEAYQESIDLNVRAGERRGAALGRYFLGCCLHELGRAEDAGPLLAQARTELRDLGDERMAARCTFSIGLVQRTLGSYQAAEQELSAAAAAFAAGKLWHYEIPAREALATLATRTGDHSSAREHLTRALQLEEAAGGAATARLSAALAALN